MTSRARDKMIHALKQENLETLKLALLGRFPAIYAEQQQRCFKLQNTPVRHYVDTPDGKRTSVFKPCSAPKAEDGMQALLAECWNVLKSKGLVTLREDGTATLPSGLTLQGLQQLYAGWFSTYREQLSARPEQMAKVCVPVRFVQKPSTRSRVHGKKRLGSPSRAACKVVRTPKTKVEEVEYVSKHTCKPARPYQQTPEARKFAALAKRFDVSWRRHCKALQALAKVKPRVRKPRRKPYRSAHESHQYFTVTTHEGPGWVVSKLYVGFWERQARLHGLLPSERTLARRRSRSVAMAEATRYLPGNMLDTAEEKAAYLYWWQLALLPSSVPPIVTAAEATGYLPGNGLETEEQKEAYAQWWHLALKPAPRKRKSTTRGRSAEGMVAKADQVKKQRRVSLSADPAVDPNADLTLPPDMRNASFEAVQKWRANQRAERERLKARAQETVAQPAPRSTMPTQQQLAARWASRSA